MRSTRVRLLLAGSCVAWLVAMAGSCASPTYLSWRLETRGFLGESAGFAPGGDGELPCVRRANDFVARPTSAFLVESPAIWRSDQAPLAEVPRSELNQVAKELEGRLREALRRRFTVVHAPSEGVLRVRIAVTEEASAWVVSGTFTTASRGRVGVARDRGEGAIGRAGIAFAARARVEVRITDAVNGDVRLEGRSDPVVSSAAGSGRATWEDVTRGFERIARELEATLRGRPLPASVAEAE